MNKFPLTLSCEQVETVVDQRVRIEDGLDRVLGKTFILNGTKDTHHEER